MEGSRPIEDWEDHQVYLHNRHVAAVKEAYWRAPAKATTNHPEPAYGTPESQADEQSQGLPVRQWRMQTVTVAPPPEREENKKQDRWAVELPHGMPRDTHLLTPHNQELLRLARSGKLYKKRPLPEEDDADADGVPGDKQDKKDSTASEGYGFKVKKWVRLERSAEDAGINHLAPRQKNTITRPSKQLGTQVTGPMVTKATVKRLDAAGNPYTQEVIVPDGQRVDGEIISTSVVPAPEATGEAVLPIATPARRKPPIPQKKKGRGRGRGGRGRGRLPLATPTRPVPQQDGSTEVKPENIGPDVSMRLLKSGRVCLTTSQGVKIESEDASRASGDIEMNESSALDDDDGDEGSGDDDEGDGDESGTPAAEGEDQEMKDAPAYAPSEPVADAPPATASAEAAQPGANLVPPPLVTDPVQLEGSPLKNVTLRSPTDPSPHLSPIATTAAAAAAAASADPGLSEVPGESTLGLQPSMPEPQQPILLSQAFFREYPVDNKSAEPPAPVPAEAAPTDPTEDSRMDGVTSTNTESQDTGPETVPNQPIVPSGAFQPVPVVESAPTVEPPPVVESLAAAEPSPVLEGPPAVETPPVIEPSPVVEPSPAVEPPAVVEPAPQVEELPTTPPKEDIPLPSNEEPMPGQATESLEQQVPAAPEPAPPSPIIAPALAPTPSPPPVAQVPVEEVMGDVGTGDVKDESGGAEGVPAEGLHVEGDIAADVVVEDAGAADVGAENAGAEYAGPKDLLGADDARAGEGATQDVGTEDVGTEDVVTEDGSFDILGSLSTSLNQQAEDDAPPPSLPARPAETVASEPAQPVEPVQPDEPDETAQLVQPAQPAEPEQPAQPAQANETGLSGQTEEVSKTDLAEETGETSKTSDTVQSDLTSEIKEEGEAQAQAQELPGKPEEQI